MFKKKLACLLTGNLSVFSSVLLLSGFLTASVSMASRASPYSDLIVFGDSILDSGQFDNPLVPGSGLRITNADSRGDFAKVGTQYLSESLGLGGLGPSTPSDTAVTVGNNYAVAGNRTDQVLASIVDVNGSVVNPAAFGLPGNSAFRNGYLVDNPQVDGNALFMIAGGANDIGQGLVFDASSAAAAANNLRLAADALNGAGANFILYSNIWDMAEAPLGAVVNLSALQALSDLYHQSVYSSLSQSSANIIPIDVQSLVVEIIQEPAAYGFDANLGSQLTSTCYDGASALFPCFENNQYGLNSAGPDAHKLLFNDGVHPTASLHSILGGYYLSILQAPAQVSLLPNMATQAVSNSMSRLRKQLNVLPAAGRVTSSSWNLLTHVSSADVDYRNNVSSADGSQSQDMAGIGLRYNLNQHWSSGVMLDFYEDSWQNTHSRYQMDGYGLTAFGQYYGPRWFANAMMGLAVLDYDDLERGMALGSAIRKERGETDGRVLSLASEVGYNLMPQSSQWSYGPRLNLSYVKTKVDAYSEASRRSTALNFYGQEQASLTSELGVYVHYVSADARLTFNAEIGIRHEHIQADDLLRMSSRSLDFSRYALPGSQQDADDEVAAAIACAYRLGKATKLTASYQRVDGDDDSNSIDFGVTLSF